MAFELEPPMGTTHARAALSACGRYRYLLARDWGLPTRPCLVCVLCNPSTADAEVDDPTIRVLMGLARRKNYGGIIVVNVYALRATDPTELRKAEDPVGPENDSWLARTFDTVGMEVLCAWGDIGAGDRATKVLAMLRERHIKPVAVRLSKAGNPVHPLRQRLDQPFVEVA